MNDFERLIEDFLQSHWTFHPIDATFAGQDGYDAALPPVDAAANAREGTVLAQLRQRLEAAFIPDDAGARLDAKLLRAQLAAASAALEARPRYGNPAWYTGEIAFGAISLLLRDDANDDEALAARIAAIPGFLADGANNVDDAGVPADWVCRARLEAAAIRRLFAAMPERAGARVAQTLLEAADAALQRFDGRIARLPDADPAAGEPYLMTLMRDVHGLSDTPATLERRAVAAYERTLDELNVAAARLDPRRTWREQLATLGEIASDSDDVRDAYRAWHERALRDGAMLLSPASEYALEFKYLPAWAQPVASDLYFLFYRSPAAYRPGGGSVYWVAPPSGSRDDDRRAHNTAAVKLVHAVHHGSVGHHTQNARARSAPSRLARISGTDCASGIMFLAAGTMVEGWACYAEDLLAEVPDFYSETERLQLIYFELRNIATALADVRLHAGTWTLDDVRRFYRDDVAFAPMRIWSETTRNSMYPASRLMYWTGSQHIKALRARHGSDPKAFHDALLGFGGAPVTWIGEELAACAPARS